MPEYTKKIYEQERVTLSKAYMGFLVGTGAILSMWFLSGLYYVNLN